MNKIVSISGQNILALRLRAMINAYGAGLAEPGSGLADMPAGPESEEQVLVEEHGRSAPRPYPGLRSFEPADDRFFFGRDDHIKALRDRLAKHHVVVVLGGSGSGKSSVVRAGLLPSLVGFGGIRGRDGRWYAAEFRPRLQPIDELIESLADQVLLQRFARLASGPKILRAILNLPAEPAAHPQGRAMLRNALHALLLVPPEVGPAERRQLLLHRLLDVTDAILDRLDDESSRGLQAGAPNLLIVVDQFEEVFRSEVTSERGGQREDLLNLIVDIHEHLSHNPNSGLFLTVTMRSEELHRCAEHPGLADVINSSSYLLDLLDPAHDADLLRKAIVAPARIAFEDWGLPLAPGLPEAPFEAGLVDWLLAGTKSLSGRLAHRPDELPLLQHALQAIWDEAIKDWSRRLAALGGDFDGHVLWLRREHLPRRRASAALGHADLNACLDIRAEDAFRKAADLFSAAIATGERVESTESVGLERRKGGETMEAEAAIRGAFRALARRDDRGNWARRFATVLEMAGFVNSSNANCHSASSIDRGLRAALKLFVVRGYLVTKGDRYDISHEALIRNWRRYQEWLRDPVDVARALARVVTDLDPQRIDPSNADADEYLRDNLPAVVCEKLAAIFDFKTFPESWAVEQLLPLLRRPAVAESWGLTGSFEGQKALAHEEALAREEPIARTCLYKIRDAASRATAVREREAADRLALERRIAEERHRSRLKKLTLGFGAILITFLMGAALLFQQTAMERKGVISRAIGSAQPSEDPDFRSRILLLLNALSQPNWPRGLWAWYQPDDRAARALEDVLRRSPRYAERDFDAVGLSQDGSKLALLKGSKLSSRGFAKSDDPQPLPVERSLDEASPPRAGFLSLSDSGEVPAVMISGKLTYWKDPREPVSIDAETFKRALGETDLFRFYDIVNGAVRTVTRQRGGPDQRKILIQEVRPGPNPQQLSVLDLIRDTRPAQQNFSPVLADGCGLLADLEQPPPTREGPLAIRLILNGLAMSRQQIDQRIRSDLILSMGFTLDCRFLVLRDRDGGSSGAQRLRIFPLSTDGKTIQAQEPQAVSVPSSDPPVPTQIPSLRPLLAVAHATNGEWRFAWEVHGGIRLETASVKPGAPTVPQRSETLLSGMSAGGSKLVFSEDGRFLTLVRQPFGSKAEVAVWDLDDINRQTAVPRSDLFARACSIVAQGHGGTRATVEEQLTWYGHVVSQQPCTPLQDNASRPNSTETSSR